MVNSLSTGAWVQLANIVAKAGIQPPKEILKVATGVIEKRELAACWYRSRCLDLDPESVEDNEGHAYFIDVLKQVYEIISSTVDASVLVTDEVQAQAAIQRDSGQPSETETTRNRFASLGNEETEPADAEVTSREISTLPLADPPSKKTGRVQTHARRNDEHVFAIWCLLEDFDSIRTLIPRIWTDCVAGKRSVMAAGVVTDAAFALMRRTNEEFASSHGKLAQWKEMLKCLDLDEGAVRRSRNRGGNAATTDAHSDDLLCPLGGKLLDEALIDINKCSSITEAGPFRSLGYFRERSPDHDFGSLLLSQISSLCLRNQAWTMYRSTTSKTLPQKTQDEFCTGIVGLISTPEVPIWLAVAGQIYIDIYDIIGGQLPCGLQALNMGFDTAEATARELDSLFSGCTKLRKVFCKPKAEFGIPGTEYRRDMQLLVDKSELIAHIMDSRAGGHSSRLILLVPTLPCFSLGDHLINLQLRTQELLNTGHFVLCMAHLYKAGRHYQLLNVWEDMEFLLRTHLASRNQGEGTAKFAIFSKSHSNAGSRAMSKNLSVASGIPPSADQSKTIPRETARKNGHWIRHQSDLIDASKEIARSCASQGKHHGDFIDVVLRELFSKAQRASQSRRRDR